MMRYIAITLGFCKLVMNAAAIQAVDMYMPYGWGTH